MNTSTIAENWRAAVQSLGIALADDRVNVILDGHHVLDEWNAHRLADCFRECDFCPGGASC